MMQARCLLLFFLCIVATLIGPGGASAPRVAAADAPANGAADSAVFKVYDVSDLIYPPPQYPLDHDTVAPLKKPSSMNGGSSLGGQPSLGGRPSQSDISFTQNYSLSPENFVKAIESNVLPDDWSDNGGRRTLQLIGSALLVEQTAEGQAKVESFLGALRDSCESSRSCAIEATWYWLSPGQLHGLLLAKGGRLAGEADAAALDKLPPDDLFAQAQIICVGGQTTHVVSGRVRTFIQNIEAEVGTAAAAYQPDIEQVLTGAALQVTPHLGKRFAIVDVVSNVGGTPRVGPAAHFGTIINASSPLTQPSDPQWKNATAVDGSVDRPDVPAQELMTTVHAPFGQTVLVGGMTIEPAMPGPGSAKAKQAAPSAGRQLYLFLHVEAQ